MWLSQFNLPTKLSWEGAHSTACEVTLASSTMGLLTDWMQILPKESGIGGEPSEAPLKGIPYIWDTYMGWVFP